MSFYPRRLKSVEELEREKKRIQKQIAELQEEKLFSKESIMAQMKGGGGEGGALGFLGKLAPAGMVPIVGKLTEMIKTRQQAKAKQSEQSPKDAVAQEPEKQNFLIRAGKEVLFGYLKWKVIELSVKGARYLYQKRKERAEQAKLNNQ